MKKKLFVFITIISLLLICAPLTACKKHTHTFDTKDTSADFLATEATCTKKATYYKSCTCGEKGTETFEYGQLAEHTKSQEIKKNASHHWYECTAEGCLAKIEESAHTVDDYNVCTFCNTEKYSTELTFELNEDNNSYRVSGIKVSADIDLIIPSVYNGKPVTSIANYAFSANIFIKTAVIGRNVTTIGDNAFRCCDNLSSIRMFNSVTTIGDSAFHDCISLQAIELSNIINSIGNNAFENCSILQNISIPSCITNIGSDAFKNCYGLQYYTADRVKYLGNEQDNFIYLVALESKEIETIEIPESCKFISANAFEFCEKLTSVIMHDNIIRIEDSAFRNCRSLSTIALSKSLKHIGSYVFSNCSSLSEIIIPNGVTHIGDSTFAECTSLITVYIPNSVTYIGQKLFFGCTSLTTITFSSQITDIYFATFADCLVLTAIYFSGSAEQWDAINIDIGNDIIETVPVYFYSENEPKLNTDETDYDGNYWHYDTDNKTPVVWKKQ